MEKKRHYSDVRFSSRIIRKAVNICADFSSSKKHHVSDAQIATESEEWNFDDLDEFLNRYSGGDFNSAYLSVFWDVTELRFLMHAWPGKSIISISGKTRTEIETVFTAFEEAPKEDRIENQEVDADSKITIFVGHGRNNQWEKLKAHLQDKHELDIVSYESGARAGHTIRDILDRMSEESSMAFLVLTGEDKTEDGIRARQNVIHECGLFQGKLGFHRAILVVEEGIELASNFDGIQQLRFKRGRISEIFGDAIATIRREFGPL